jgi:hypothetical protein
VFSSDVYLGGVSGLGDGTATMALQGNLSTCVFYGTGNVSLAPTDDPQSVLVYGPNGVILRDEGKACIFKLTPEGIEIILNGQSLFKASADGISLNFKGKSIAITEDGIAIEGNNLTSIDGHNFLLHEHSNVQTGSSNTGGVTP